MVADGSYTCGEHNITYREAEAESLCYIPETNIELCQLYSNLLNTCQIIRGAAKAV